MAVPSFNGHCQKRSVSDGLAAVSKALAHKEAELAGAADVLPHRAVGHGGDLRNDVQFLGDVKRAELPGPWSALEQGRDPLERAHGHDVQHPPGGGAWGRSSQSKAKRGL